MRTEDGGFVIDDRESVCPHFTEADEERYKALLKEEQEEK